MKKFFQAAAVVALLSGAAVATLPATAAVAAQAPASAAALQGRWDAVLIRNGVEIPFRLDIKGEGPTLQGVFYDGFRPYDGTTSATFQNGKLVLNVEHYLTTITADLGADGKLTGNVVAQNRESSADYAFRAVRHVETPKVAVNAPSIAGNYIIPLATPSSKGEKAFRFIVQQNGAEVAASILRIDGDTGAYTGEFKDGKWRLSHFDGGRPGIIEVTPKADGTLEILQQVERPGVRAASASGEYGVGGSDGRYASTLVAYRQDVAQAKGFAAPSEPLKHTTWRDADETFKFSFPDVNGKLVSNEDPRFKGKVIVAVVTGTWCPNCHDEAQYLVELDKQYREKGLAIVALNFEEPEQQGDGLRRQKAFVKQYGVKYDYLLAGAPAEMWEKVPQLNNLNTWPATIFIGRDGKIDAVHSGFASPSTGEFYAKQKAEFTRRIETLLAEPAPRSVASTNAVKLANAR